MKKNEKKKKMKKKNTKKRKTKKVLNSFALGFLIEIDDMSANVFDASDTQIMDDDLVAVVEKNFKEMPRRVNYSFKSLIYTLEAPINIIANFWHLIIAIKLIFKNKFDDGKRKKFHKNYFKKNYKVNMLYLMKPISLSNFCSLKLWRKKKKKQKRENNAQMDSKRKILFKKTGRVFCFKKNMVFF